MSGDTELPGLDLAALESCLADLVCRPLQGPLTGRLLAGGRSNLTYLISDGSADLVLRRPPLGHVLATAHDMSREYRVLDALSGSKVPVPAPILLVTDPSVIGAPFYLMTWVKGTVYRTKADSVSLDGAAKRTLAHALVDTLAELHSISPETVGLADYGRPMGYLDRQVRRWHTQLTQSTSRPVQGIAELHAELARSIPASARSGIVHGDFRLDNALFSPTHELLAVLDWEMATVGDPLADVGVFLAYWDGLGATDNPVATGMGTSAGFPGGGELVERYAARLNITVDSLDWYVGFGYYKLAVIFEGIHFRFVQGQTVGDGFSEIGKLVEPMVERGLATLGKVAS